MSVIVETLNSASKGKSKGKGKKGSVDPGLLHGRTVAGNIAETACGGKPPDVATVWETGRAIEKPKGEERPKAKEKASYATCAE